MRECVYIKIKESKQESVCRSADPRGVRGSGSGRPTGIRVAVGIEHRRVKRCAPEVIRHTILSFLPHQDIGQSRSSKSKNDSQISNNDTAHPGSRFFARLPAHSLVVILVCFMSFAKTYCYLCDRVCDFNPRQSYDFF